MAFADFVKELRTKSNEKNSGQNQKNDHITCSVTGKSSLVIASSIIIYSWKTPPGSHCAEHTSIPVPFQSQQARRSDVSFQSQQEDHPLFVSGRLKDAAQWKDIRCYNCKPPDNGWEWVIYGVGSLCLSFTPYDAEKTTKGMLRFFVL